MPDSRRPDNPEGDALALRALLYASGELDAAEAAAFEERLGTDQEAREALAVAAQLAHAVPGEPAPRPDPAYRARVRERLASHGPWRWLTARRYYPGHPAVWAAGGACAAALLIAVGLWVRSPNPGPAPATGLPPVAQAPAAPKGEAVVQAPELLPAPRERNGFVAETALAWAELGNSDHLQKTLDDEARRKLRLRDWIRRHGDATARERLPVPFDPLN